MAQSSVPNPRRYVEGLLLWQGSAWLVLAAAGLGYWLATLPRALTGADDEAGMLWRVGELIAVAIAAGLGSTEVTMAWRLRSARKVRSAVRLGVDRVTSNAGLIVIWMSLVVAVSALLFVA